jgi:hypothetical protein
MTVFTCKLHNHPYTVCRACKHQFCAIYWRECPRCYARAHGHERTCEAMREPLFRYDLAAMNDPRVILITDTIGSRRAIPRLGYVVLPSFGR